MAWNKRFSSPWLVYPVALLSPVGAALLRLGLLDALGMSSPFLTFYPPVLLAALLGGFPAGLLATAISGCLALFLWIEPSGRFTVSTLADRLDLALFLAGGLVVSSLAELMRRAQARAEAAQLGVGYAAEREQALLGIRDERDFLRQVIDALPGRVSVRDQQGNLCLVNRALAQFCGSTVTAMLGKRASDFDLLPQAFQAGISEEDREAVALREAPLSGDQVVDNRGESRSFETATAPLLNGDGTWDKLLVVTQDVTKRKRAEEALNGNCKLLSSIIMGTPDAIYVKDTTGKYLLFNRAAQNLTGKQGEDVLGRDDTEIFPGQDAQTLMKEDRAVMAARAIKTFESSVMDTQGRKRVFLSTKGPMYDEQGNLTGIFGISRDISEQKQAEEEFRNLNDELDKRVAERTAQLEAANREQESFSYSVSHDLRSPLRHINSYTAILIEEFGADISPEGRDYLDRICKASSKMGKLIDDLLELARTSRLPLTEEQINLSRLATISSLLLQQTDKTRRVEFTIAEGMQVLGDKTLLRLVVENLLNNAWKYTVQEKVARIEVGAEVIDGQEVFFVSDNGTGFDMAYNDKLFGAFQRLHGAEYEGNGIGLATVKRAIERHGGTIWAEGEVGSGATFYFTLAKEELCYPQQVTATSRMNRQ